MCFSNLFDLVFFRIRNRAYFLSQLSNKNYFLLFWLLHLLLSSPFQTRSLVFFQCRKFQRSRKCEIRNVLQKDCFCRLSLFHFYQTKKECFPMPKRTIHLSFLLFQTRHKLLPFSLLFLLRLHHAKKHKIGCVFSFLLSKIPKLSYPLSQS